jgi:hypothetical protein
MVAEAGFPALPKKTGNTFEENAEEKKFQLLDSQTSGNGTNGDIQSLALVHLDSENGPQGSSLSAWDILQGKVLHGGWLDGEISRHVEGFVLPPLLAPSAVLHADCAPNLGPAPR